MRSAAVAALAGLALALVIWFGVRVLTPPDMEVAVRTWAGQRGLQVHTVSCTGNVCQVETHDGRHHELSCWRGGCKSKRAGDVW